MEEKIAKLSATPPAYILPSRRNPFLGEITDGGGSFRWSSAGHPPPLLQRDGTVSFLQDGTGVLLGVTSGEGAEEAVVDLRPGDVVVLYTDGLIERRDQDLDEGLDQLVAALVELRGLPLEELCDRLLDRLLDEDHEDDVALVAVRVRQPPPQLGA